MSRPVARLAIETDHELLSGYADFCATLGVTDRALRDRLRSARAFLGTHPDVDAWLARPLPTRLADLRRIRAWPLLSYLALEGTIRLDIDLLLAKNQGGFGLTAERYWRVDFERVRGVATRLGWAPSGRTRPRRSWSASRSCRRPRSAGPCSPTSRPARRSWPARRSRAWRTI